MNKNSKKLLGIFVVLLVISMGTGGLKGCSKLFGKFSKKSVSSGRQTITDESFDSFDSIEVEGNANVYMVTEDYFKNPTWLSENELLDSTQADKADVYHVIVIREKSIPEPKISLNKGHLKIDSNRDNNWLFGIFSDNDLATEILICCPKKEMKSLKVDVDTGNIMLGEISYKKAEFETDTGYIQLTNVAGDKQDIQSDTGDLFISGKFNGKIEADSDTGDVNLSGEFKEKVKATSDTGSVCISGNFNKDIDINSDTGDITIKTPSDIKSSGEINLETDTGDIIIKENGKDIEKIDGSPAKYSHEGSGKRIKVQSDTGDIVLSFGEKID
ncbi:Putative adhesin [Acetitomaculum ruminis DSM 5522]|uniref:Putative adhesin n=1 Tax=Acetitomaculum ruminis DSM 5522 TaxID=1120918 RepID=A0A1I0ZTR6_9FIRM|nr:DUF4097 family beta strand repeat-containing protein [Acetitomaculum ruminis]SFB29169.1 Putative adhesin [Acetitomaculum ruminis DSM 5522]